MDVTSRTRGWGSAILGVYLALLLPAFAQAGQKQAREYYKRAQKLYQQGRFERAAKLLDEAYDEEPNLTYQYNRIRALQGAEKYQKALDVLEAYEQPLLDADGYENVQSLKRKLRAKVDSSATNDSTSDASSETSDEAETSRSPSTSESASSDRDTPRDASEPESQSTSLSQASGISDGETSSLPQPSASSGTSTPNSTDSSARRRRPLAWSLVGTGSALAAGGTVLSTGVHLWGVDGPPSSGASSKTLTTHRVIAGSALGLGAAATTVGLVLLTRHRGAASSSRTSRDASSPSIDVALVPRLGSSGGGAVFEIDF